MLRSFPACSQSTYSQGVYAQLRGSILASSQFSILRSCTCVSTIDINSIAPRMFLGSESAYCFKQMSGHAPSLLLENVA